MSQESGFGPAPDAVDAPGADRFAITSFIFALLGVVPVSVMLGIVGLVRIQRTGRLGRGLAVSGLVISGIWLIGGVIALVSSLVVAPNSQSALGHIQSQRTATSEPITTPVQKDVTDPYSVFYVSVDNCYDWASDGDRVQEMDCAVAHDEQVFGTVTLSGASYPASDVKDQVRAGCRKQISSYFTTGKPSAELSAEFYSPSEGNWNDGVRYGLCSFKKASGKLTGRVPH